MADTYLTRHTLLRRLKSKNDNESWEEFVSYYQYFIQSVISKMGIKRDDVDDLTQAVLVKVWKSLANFDYNQKQGYFRNWLYTVTKNTVLSHLSKNKRKINESTTDSLTDTSINIVTSPDIDMIIQQEWEKFISKRALASISNKVSALSLDCFLSRLRKEPVAETAERTGLEESTIYKYHNRVKQKMMEEIRHLRETLE